MSWALGVLSGVAVAVALAAVIPLLAGSALDEQRVLFLRGDFGLGSPAERPLGEAVDGIAEIDCW